MIVVTEPAKNASPLQVVKAVLWSFFGVRRRAEHEADAVRLKPSQVIITGILLAVVFVLVLVTIVRIVLSVAGT